MTCVLGDDFSSDYIAPPTDLQEYGPSEYYPPPSPQTNNLYYVDSKTIDVFSERNGELEVSDGWVEQSLKKN